MPFEIKKSNATALNCDWASFGYTRLNSRGADKSSALYLVGDFLTPLVGRVDQALIDDAVEAAALLDKDFREGAVLAEEDSLQADEFQKREEHGTGGELHLPHRAVCREESRS